MFSLTCVLFDICGLFVLLSGWIIFGIYLTALPVALATVCGQKNIGVGFGLSWLFLGWTVKLMTYWALRLPHTL